MVWVQNGKQNSGLVNFVQESRLPFTLISYIYRKTAAKGWNWYHRWLWRNATRTSVWNIPTGKTGLAFQMFRCFRKFSAGGRTRKVVFYLLSNRIFRKLFVNGKQPRNWRTKNQNICIFFQLPLISQSLRISWKPNCRGYREMRRINQLHCSFIGLFFCLCLRLRQSDPDMFFTGSLVTESWAGQKLCLWLPWFVF